MQDYLQHYQMKFTALAPVYVGSGQTIDKKSYIQYGIKSPVIIPDREKMIRELCLLHKEQAYEQFMLRGNQGGNDSLAMWLTEQKIDRQRVLGWARYTMDAGDAFIKANGGKGTCKEINCFCKDAYGMPYIPGSTLKGMIRTALLAWEMKRNPSAYAGKLRDLERSSAMKKNRNKYLLQETKKIETQAFHLLPRMEKRPEDAVNSVMSGLIIGDSRSIPVKQLVLCQKIDYSLKGAERALPILREAIKPGTEVFFDLTIDTQILPYSIEDIQEALNLFQEDCYQYFYKRFRRGREEKGIVWLGGGTGFVSKTILYNAFAEQGVKVADQTFQVTVGKKYAEHHHDMDRRLGVAPHVCKCTRYSGKLYDMGMGRLEVME